MATLAPLLGPAPPGFGRAFGRATVFGYQRGVTIPLAGARVVAYVPGTGTPWTGLLYDDESATTPAVFPQYADPGGGVDLWAAEPCRVELECFLAGYQPQRVTLDIQFPADYADPDLATDEEVAEALAEHEAAPDPHPAYLTEPEATALYPLKTAPDPYPQYATDADLAGHAAAADPHPQYATDADLAGHAGAADPHAQYATDADVAGLAAVYQALSQRNQPNGYPGLDPAGKVPTAALPPLAITDIFVVNSEAAMLALAAQVGDFCVRSDVSQTYALAQEPASVLASWVPLMGGGTAAVTSVDGRIGAVVLSDLYANVTGDTFTGAVLAPAFTQAGRAVLDTDHTAAADPHPVYASDADLSAHAAAANPHPVYATDADHAALTTRVGTLEGQVATLQAAVATLQSQMAGHTHQTGTVQRIAGTPVMP